MTAINELIAAQGGSRSTAAVLWLMILLVFLPIASLHAAARLVGPAPAQQGSLR